MFSERRFPFGLGWVGFVRRQTRTDNNAFLWTTEYGVGGGVDIVMQARTG